MDSYLGEIRLFGGNFEPRDWAFCRGQLLSIAEYSALFSVLGVRYGGDGRSTFALPNLSARVPLGAGAGPGLTNRDLGATGGSTAVTLREGEIPSHTHQARGVAANGTVQSPVDGVWAQFSRTRPLVQANVYGDSAPDVQMAAQALAAAGNSQPHNNMQPYLAMNFIICLQGEYPQRP
jgi:microcystin-dependent protein